MNVPYVGKDSFFFFNTLARLFFMRLHEFCFTFMKFVCRVMISCLYVNDEVGKMIFQIRLTLKSHCN